MGKIVQVKSTVGYGGVRLPPANAVYLKGENATLTDKEYGGLSVNVRNVLTILKSGIPDPLRGTTAVKPSSNDDILKLAKEYTDSSVKGALTILNQNNKFSYRVVATGPNTYPSRPSGVAAGQVVYVGPSQPTDWLVGDAWDDTSGS